MSHIRERLYILLSQKVTSAKNIYITLVAIRSFYYNKNKNTKYRINDNFYYNKKINHNIVSSRKNCPYRIY